MASPNRTGHRQRVPPSFDLQRLREIRKQAAQAHAERQRRMDGFERLKKAILDGASGPTLARELTEKERQLAVVESRIADAQTTVKPALMPPRDVIASLHTEEFYARRRAYRALVSRVELKSVRKKGSRMVDHWVAMIEPTAGITGLPEFIRIGRNHKRLATKPIKLTIPGWEGVAA